MDRTPQETPSEASESVGNVGVPEESAESTQELAPVRDEPDGSHDAEQDATAGSADLKGGSGTHPKDSDTGPVRAPLGTVPMTGPIPVVGDALPITGAVPVIRPIYPPKRRLPWIISTVALALLVLGGAYLGWRMYEVNTEWQAYAADLEDANYELGSQIAVEQGNVMDKQAEVDLLSEQLSTSNDRLLDLADEKASAVDGQEFNEQVIEQLQTTLNLGTAATASLNSCIDGLEQLNEYLAAPEDEYDPEEIQDYADGVNELCTDANSATSTFQRSLTESTTE
ncbi:hypothetical protein [Demequina globuliformis]|uniref:hypothetical protein n=1 Tax=Demequina globuliformis TaxID=676202 RepID=UPI0007845C4D|nr:hypothetical protein [Demequina globuliformis]